MPGGGLGWSKWVVGLPRSAGALTIPKSVDGDNGFTAQICRQMILHPVAVNAGFGFQGSPGWNAGPVVGLPVETKGPGRGVRLHRGGTAHAEGLAGAHPAQSRPVPARNVETPRVGQALPLHSYSSGIIQPIDGEP